jgi:hypothetical protein
MKRARATKRRMELMTSVACNKEGNGNGYKSDCDEGDGQVTATWVMVTAKANNNQPATGATKAGSGWRESIIKAATQARRWATRNNKSVQWIMMAATKRARAMVMAIWVVGNKEG